MIYINSAAATNVGRVRGNNEDNFYLCGQYREDTDTKNCAAVWSGQCESSLFGVCDGMGGAQYGELASLIAVQTMAKYDASFKNDCLDCVLEANALVCDEINRHGGSRIGTTFAALHISGDTARICNIGDSRIYFMRGGEFKQLSVDHTQAQMLVRQGILSPEAAQTHRSRHVLTQHIGIFPDEMIIEPYMPEPMKLLEGDSFLLCSDGLTDMVSDAQIEEIMRSGLGPEVTADLLVDHALRGGGKDNVTVLLVSISTLPDGDKSSSRLVSRLRGTE